MSSEDEASKKAPELEDAAACGELWKVYEDKAQGYEGLIMSWKEDMDATLVFSGLYSAVLTAFIIESYKNLQPDPVKSSAVLLKRISEQLGDHSDGSSLTPLPDDEAFSPTSSALACNILWFISLALALTCAFMATLVRQWSRQFLNKTSTALLESPGSHAHLLQFLYFGLEDLRMHAVVDLVYSSLHLSVFNFFAGLVCFFKDINTPLAALFALLLGLLLSFYSLFTLLPLVYLKSPYSTPLSPVLWRIWHFTKAISDSLRVQAARFWNWLSQMKPDNQGQNPNEISTLPDNVEAQQQPLVEGTELVEGRHFTKAIPDFLCVRAVQFRDWLSRMKPDNQGQNQSENRTPQNDEERQQLPVVEGTELVEGGHFTQAIPDFLRVQAVRFRDWLSQMKPDNQGQNQNENRTLQSCEKRQQPPSPSDSLIDATLRESKKRHPDHESRCITWTMNSLNDDAALLPFLEALPRALLNDDLDCLREGNLHLMNALVSKTDIVSRTVSLMKNAIYSWHEEKHRTRCALAGARTLYSLARVLVDRQYRAKFTYPNRYSSPGFTGEILERVSQELARTPEIRPFQNSVVVLGVLSVIQSLDHRIQACTPDQRIPHSWFQEANTLLEDQFYGSDQAWMKKSRNEFSQEQAKVAIREMISAAFNGYLRRTMDGPSFNLVHISKQLEQDGSDFLQAGSDPGDLFFYLDADYRTSLELNKHADIERMNTIFRIGFEGLPSIMLAKGSEKDQLNTMRWILNIISARFSIGGWGSTKELWSDPERLLKLFEYLQKFKGFERHLVYTASDSAVQELLLHTIDEGGDAVISFLEDSLIHSRKMRKSHLWFLVVIVVLCETQYDKEGFSSILDQINEELPVDPEWNDISPCPRIEDEAYPQVTVILHCLDSKLPAQDTRDILQLFFRCFPWGFYGSDMLRRPNILHELVIHSQHFATQFLRAPSKELIDITALVWSLLNDILPSSTWYIDNARGSWQGVRSGLIFISNSADQLLSPDGRRTVDEEIKKSTPEQNRTILTDESDLKRLKLLDVVESVQKRLPEILKMIDKVHPPTVTSPLSSNTVDKTTELATDDHNTSQTTNLPQVTDIVLAPAAPYKAEVGVEYESLLDGDGPGW